MVVLLSCFLVVYIFLKSFAVFLGGFEWFLSVS